MAKFQLWLSSAKQLELLKTSLSHDLISGSLICTRGKVPGAYGNHGTFSWTPAVQALSILALKSSAAAFRLATEDALPYRPFLEGGNNTPASSLDYAIRKQPTWLIEMFGWDKDGNALAKKFFKRSNSNRRIAGPVAVSLNSMQIPLSVIEIYLENELIEDPEKLENLASELENNWNKKRPKLITKESEPKEKPEWSEFFKRIHVENIEQNLFKTDIFNKKNVLETVKSITSDPSFKKVYNKNTSLVDEVELSLTTSYRYGISNNEKEVKKYLCPAEPIRCAFTCSLAAPNALFFYLKHIKGYNLEIDTRFIHAADVAQTYISGNLNPLPDLMLMGTAPAATLLALEKKGDFKPLMLMPAMSQTLIAKNSNKKQNSKIGSGNYLLHNETPTTASFYFEELERKRIVDSNKVGIHHMEPEETLKTLKDTSDETKAILFFPYHLINLEYNNCREVTEAPDASKNKEPILFVNKEFATNKKRLLYLNIAIRDAWLELRANPKMRKEMAELITSDKLYEKFVRRVSGYDFIVG